MSPQVAHSAIGQNMRPQVAHSAIGQNMSGFAAGILLLANAAR